MLINWTREIRTRSTLRALPVHGPDRHEAYAEWGERGGVAITTFDTLHTLPAPADPSPKGKRAGTDAPTAPTLGMLVVDEAHYVKNPDTRRTRSVALWTERCDRVLFLTGTPMENRVEEFRTLVRHLRPDLLPAVRNGTAAAGPHAFRKSVAPAYLRRNQEDVLTELPALVQVDEWVELGVADREAYDRAVGDGNFMAMRRAAYADPEKSAKLQRLRELVAEAADNGVKVVVFSYFRDVLAAVEQARRRACSAPSPEASRRPADSSSSTTSPRPPATPSCSPRSRRAASASTSRPPPSSSSANPRSSRRWSTRPWPASTAWARYARSRCTACSPPTAWTTGS